MFGNGYKEVYNCFSRCRHLSVPVVDGLEHGLGLVYTIQDGYMSIVGTLPFVYGKKEGMYKVFSVDKNGKKYLRQMIPLVDNQIHGVRKWFYPNGTVEGIEPNQFGKREGVTMTYHENGEVRSVAHWKNDQLDAWVRRFNENGQTESESFYHNNQKLIERSFERDGSYIEKKYTSEGFYDGPVKAYRSDGSLDWVEIYYPKTTEHVFSKIQYLNGKPVIRERFDFKGDLVHKRVHTVGGWMTLDESCFRRYATSALSDMSTWKNTTAAERDAERREIVQKYHTKYPMFARQKTHSE